ncbi:MAG: insulinase family protein, partial [Gammaproteobacteria bacterium]
LDMTESRSFSISVSLTPEGLIHRDTIIGEIFRTIRLIETTGIDSWRFDELKVISDANFKFEEESDPQNVVTYLSEKLHSVPPQQLFTYGRQLRRFDGQLVKDMLSWLTPERTLIRVTAPEIEPTETTTYYPTPIRRFSLQKDRLKAFQNARAEVSRAVRLPEPNPFIQAPSEPLPKTRKATIETQPRVLFFSEGAMGYVLTENRYSQPRSDLYIRLRTPLAANSPEASIMCDLLSDAINEHLNSLSYAAALAGAGFSAQATQSGITLQFSGYHQSLISLVNQVLDSLPIPLIDESTWSRLHQLKSQGLARVQAARPSSRLFDEVTAELMPFAYSSIELNEAFASIDRQTFHQYQKAFFSGLKTEMFLHGPVSRNEGQALLESWIQRLPIDQATPEIKVTTNAWSGERLRSYQYDHPDQAATVLYVDTNTDPRSRILNQLAGNLIEAPFYTHLRTEKQLGYITFATAFPLYNTPILTGVIQSPTANPDELASAIQSEFEGFAATVELMLDEQFESQRLSLLDQLLNPPSTQGELSNEIW